MKKLIRPLLLLCMFMIFSASYGQKVRVTEVKLLINDIYASKNELRDANNQVCAVVRVRVPALQGLAFSHIVDKPKYSAGEYIVYVSPGTETMQFYKDDKVLCEVNFADKGVEIVSRATYLVQLDVDQLSEYKEFKITPANSTVVLSYDDIVSGNTVSDTLALDEEGYAAYKYEPDVVYNYTISAPGYVPCTSDFMVLSNDTEVPNVITVLEREMTLVKFICKAKKCKLWVNGEAPTPNEYVRNGEDIMVPVGINEIIVESDKYEVWKEKVRVNKDTKSLVIQLVKSKDDVSTELRSRTSLFLSGGLAFTLENRTNLKKETIAGYPARIGFDWEKYVSRWFTFRTGVDVGLLPGKNLEVDKKSPLIVDIPILFSFNLPLGRFNRNHFSIGAGPLLGYASLVNLRGGDQHPEAYDDEYDKGKLLVGGRVEARFTLDHFITGMNVDYYYSEGVMKGHGYICPMLTIGYKF